MIAIVNLGTGNLGSIANMLRRVGVEALVTEDAATVASADRLILPGVGSFDRAATRLNSLGLRPVLEQKVGRDKTPLLGICLGMQLLTRGSEEGREPGLGFIPGHARRFCFQPSSGLKVPHMGWNTVRPLNENALFSDLGHDPRFYFVHSYYVSCDDLADVAAVCQYGHDFSCAVVKNNVAGVQFHPEKSHRFGLTLLKNFVERF